jgi:cobalamin biosynthesis protein CbiG
MDTDNSTKHRAVIFYITRDGHDLARKITGLYPDAEVLKFNTLIFAEKWQTVKNIICIMATGIVIRIMAPLLQDKKTDPAVVVLDEKGRFTVSLLSGHIGGANALAKKIADFLGAEPVITTASDVQGKIALDLWAVERNLFVEDFEKLKTLSTRVVNNRKLKVYSDYPFYKKAVPEEFVMAAMHDGPDIIISSRIIDAASFATGTPESTDIPASANFKAGASLTPSPRKPTM